MQTVTRKPSFVVRKYGGSSLATPQQFKAIAGQLSKLVQAGHKVLVVVSARGKTTDELIRMAHEVSIKPDRRELDMLVSVGERISMALMAMALRDQAVRAISFTGSQAGILTSRQYTNAFIQELKPARVEKELELGSVVVLAGFQGVSPETKEVTTLGRGGSDVTAVALAAHFRSESCDICKDVDGLYSADPKLVDRPFHRPMVGSDALLDMTFWGAKLLHYRSVELAVIHAVPLKVRLAHPPDNHEERMTQMKIDPSSRGALSTDGVSVTESPRLLSLNSLPIVRRVSIVAASPSDALKVMRKALERDELPLPQVINISPSESGWSVLFSSPSEVIGQQVVSVAGWSGMASVDARSWSTVTATCQGLYASALAEELTSQLNAAGIQTEMVLFGAMSVTWLVSEDDRDAAVRTLHSSPYCQAMERNDI